MTLSDQGTVDEEVLYGNATANSNYFLYLFHSSIAIYPVDNVVHPLNTKPAPVWIP